MAGDFGAAWSAAAVPTANAISANADSTMANPDRIVMAASLLHRQHRAF
jgi:hypothetical protein